MLSANFLLNSVFENNILKLIVRINVFLCHKKIYVSFLCKKNEC